jgi:hypothetical protein
MCANNVSHLNKRKPFVFDNVFKAKNKMQKKTFVCFLLSSHRRLQESILPHSVFLHMVIFFFQVPALKKGGKISIFCRHFCAWRMTVISGASFVWRSSFYRVLKTSTLTKLGQSKKS